MRSTELGPVPSFDFDDAVERDPADLCRRNDQPLQAFDARAKLVDRPHANVVLVGACVEGRRFLAGDERVQRLRNIADAHAQIGRRVAVDLKLHLRLAADQRRVDVDRVRDRLHLLEDLCRVFLEFFQVRPGDHELDVRVAKTAARECRDRLDARCAVRRETFVRAARGRRPSSCSCDFDACLRSALSFT